MIDSDTQVNCDLIVLKGECFVNESNFTGESDPVPKVKLVQNTENFSFTKNQESLIYEGTLVINSKNDDNIGQAQGLVIRTGFSTKKGQVCYWMFSDEKMPTSYIWLKYGEGLTAFSAPTLIPMTNLCMLMALIRLQNKKIQGVHPQSIYNAGGLQVMCFDKTGTVTQNTIKTKGYWSNFSKFVSVEQFFNQQKNQNNQICKEDQKIQQLFATCHSLQNSKHQQDQLLGDIIDVQMFQISNYKIETKNNLQQIIPKNQNDNDLPSFNILKRFDFKSENACMSVIAQEIQNHSKQYVFIKGSPEKLKQISKKDTIPQNYDDILHDFTIQGFRVLALAYREIYQEEQQNIEQIERNQLENNLNFIGFLILENPLKSNSKEVFQRLIEADIPLKIISGDNNYTACYTAQSLTLFNEEKPIYFIEHINNKQENYTKIILQKNKNIVKYQKNFKQNEFQDLLKLLNEICQNQENQIAITGNFILYLQSFISITNSQKDQEISNILQNLIIVSRVFSRCTPDVKQNIIKNLKEQKLKVGMIGDGANDCLAIQEATIGISFATADAALSSSFCTSLDSIQCVEQIIAEGRSTLAINYDLSHYLYATGVFAVIVHFMLIYQYQMPNDGQLTYIGYFGGYIICQFFYTWSKPLNIIKKERINYLMTSKRSFIGILGRWSLCIVGCIIIKQIFKAQDFYEDDIEILENDKLNKTGQLNTIIFYMYSLIVAAIPIWNFSSQPSKQSIYYNPIVTLLCLFQVTLCTILQLSDEKMFKNLKLVEIPQNFRNLILIISWLVIILQVIFEKIVIKRFYLINNQKSIILNM